MSVDKELENAVLLGDSNRLKELIKKGINLNKKDNFHRTVLYDAIVKGNLDIVKLLCKAGIELNTHDKDGKTPLHFSAIHSKLEIAKLLVEYGAIVDSVDKDGNSPLSDAVFYSKGLPDLIFLLLKVGANPDLENHYEISPRLLAESIDNYDIKQFFK